MFVQSHARVQLIKMGQCQCTDPFGWTDQPDKRPYALSLRRQVPGVPRCKKKPHPTPIRGKRLRDTPVSPPTPSEEGGCNLFHRLGVECPWSCGGCRGCGGCGGCGSDCGVNDGSLAMPHHGLAPNSGSHVPVDMTSLGPAPVCRAPKTTPQLSRRHQPCS